MVLRAAHPDRVFFEVAQARNGLAGIEKNGFRRANGVNILARHGGDAREVLYGIERAALCGQHGPGIARQPHQIGPGGHGCAFFDQHFNLHCRVEHTEEGGGNWKARHDDRIAGVHHAGKARIRGDYAFGGDIMASFRQANTEIFG